MILGADQVAAKLRQFGPHARPGVHGLCSRHRTFNGFMPGNQLQLIIDETGGSCDRRFIRPVLTALDLKH